MDMTGTHRESGHITCEIGGLLIPGVLAGFQVGTDLGDALVIELVPEQRNHGENADHGGDDVDNDVDAGAGSGSLDGVGNVADSGEQQHAHRADEGGGQLHAEAEEGGDQAFLALAQFPVAVLEGVADHARADVGAGVGNAADEGQGEQERLGREQVHQDEAGDHDSVQDQHPVAFAEPLGGPGQDGHADQGGDGHGGEGRGDQGEGVIAADNIDDVEMY